MTRAPLVFVALLELLVGQASSQKVTNHTLTAVAGIKVGHHTLAERPTGCTAIIVEQGAVGGVDVRGSAPGTRGATPVP